MEHPEKCAEGTPLEEFFIHSYIQSFFEVNAKWQFIHTFSHPVQRSSAVAGKR